MNARDDAGKGMVVERLEGPEATGGMTSEGSTLSF